MKPLYVVSLFLFLNVTLPAVAQESNDTLPPTVAHSLKELVRTSNYLMRNLSHTTAAYPDTARQLLQDAKNPGKAPYLAFLPEIAVFVKHADGYTAFKWPHALNRAADELAQTHSRRQFLDKQFTQVQLRNKFLDEVHPAYWQTLTTTYVWIEYVRRAYLYNERAVEGTDYYDRLTGMLQKMHEQAQTLIGIMARLRVEADFRTEEPHFESQYGQYFHAGNLINFGWKKAQTDLTHYFAPYFFPLLVPNESERTTIERLMAKYPQLRDSKELKALLEEIRKNQEAASANKDDRTTLTPPPMNPPSTNEGFVKEPEYLIGNRTLHTEILKLQYQASRQDLSLDSELIESLETFAAEVQKLVERYPKLQTIVSQCRTLIDDRTKTPESKTLVEALQKILSGENGIRPGYPALKPLPPSEVPDSKTENADDERVG